MASDQVTVLIEGEEYSLRGHQQSGDLLVTQESLEESLGWHLDERGLCREDECIPLQDRTDLLRDNSLRLETFAERTGRPYAQELDPPVASLGPRYDHNDRQPAAGKAPDFTLPDLEGNQFSLSDFEGKKIFLLVWASW